MKKLLSLSLLLVYAVILNLVSVSQTIKYPGNINEPGFKVKTDNLQNTVIRFSLSEFTFNDIIVNGDLMNSVTIPGVFLPNAEGLPDLPGSGKYIAVPEGALVRYKILSSRADTLHAINIAPAPRIPLDTEDGPLVYEKNKDIYSKNAFFPNDPVHVSAIKEMRGINVVELGIIPFQYNPVTKDLIVYSDIVIQVSFDGGTGRVGNNKSKNRYWDSMLKSMILNTDIISSANYENQSFKSSAADPGGCDYLIITPDNPDFLAWADSIKQFRTLQGISTNVITTKDLGSNTVAAIESYVNNAYTNWTTPPAAVLLLGDYDTSAVSTTGITSQLYVHPGGYPDYPSDNKFADVTGDELPDIVFARIPATNASQLSVMVSKFINYERNPPIKASFYSNPVTALGWQTERWFQLCSEVVGGYFKKVQGKTPVRINALYSGAPASDPWSTAANTSTILSYFGPDGLGYIPSTPQETGGFTGGTASAIVSAINSGSFLLLHRDHGSYSSWGEPAFNTSNISALQNVNNELPFIFSINCQTGAIQRSTESLAEKFHRYTYNGQNSGALGVIAPTEVSYSFLNDTYLWGVFGNLFPDFMPDKAPRYATSFVMPAFANAAGKYFLFQSNWSGYGSTFQQVTARLFHSYSDAFSVLYTEVPKALTIVHDASLQNGVTSFSVTADAGSFIALVANGSIVGKAEGTGLPVIFSIPAQNAGDVLNVTVTKQNYFRYSGNVKISAGSMVADFSGTPNSVVTGGNVTYTDLSTNNPTAWSWSFPGGTPSASTLKNPVVTYSTNGSYNVTLTSSSSTESNTKTKTAYVTVGSPVVVAAFSANVTSIQSGDVVNFSDLSTNNPTSWLWSFPGGTPSSSILQNPVVTYSTAGSYTVILTASNSSGSNTITKTSYIQVSTRIPVADFSASTTSLLTDASTTCIDLSTNNPTSWAWSFPGGTPATSTLQNPVVSYASSGTYSVSLTASNSAGSSSKTKTAYITVNTAPPVADFSADETTVISGGDVTFSDLSTGNPTSWSWSFTGGIPATSSLQYPVVTYNSDGVYTVSLTVSNAGGSGTKTLAGYINVLNGLVTYCSTGSLSSATEWISQVKFGTFVKASAGTMYSDFTAQQIVAVPGSTLSFSLSSGFSGKARKEFWRIWIDYNSDGDFTDAGESVYSGTGQKGSVSGSFIVSSTAFGQARMRVSMKYGAYPLPCETFNYGEVEDYMLDFSTDVMPLFTDNVLPGLSIYPNPTRDFITVFTGSENSEAFIYELKGTLLINRVINNHDIIDLRDFPGGIYLMKVLIDGTIHYGKIVKQ